METEWKGRTRMENKQNHGIVCVMVEPEAMDWAHRNEDVKEELVSAVAALGVVFM